MHMTVKSSKYAEYGSFSCFVLFLFALFVFVLFCFDFFVCSYLCDLESKSKSLTLVLSLIVSFTILSFGLIQRRPNLRRHQSFFDTVRTAVVYLGSVSLIQTQYRDVQLELLQKCIRYLPGHLKSVRESEAKRFCFPMTL